MDRGLQEWLAKLYEIATGKFFSEEVPGILKDDMQSVKDAIESFRPEVEEAVSELVDLYDKSGPLYGALENLIKHTLELGGKLASQFQHDEDALSRNRAMKNDVEFEEFYDSILDESRE
jgi:hypothetical protein